MIFRLTKALSIQLVLLSLILSACQGNPSPTPNPSPKPPISTPTLTNQDPAATQTPDPRPTLTLTKEPPQLKGLSLTFWHPWQGDVEKEVNTLVAEFNRKNQWGLKVQARSFYNTSGLEDSLESAWQNQGQERPDIIAAPPDLLTAWTDAGQLVELDPYLKDEEYGLSSEAVSDYKPIFWTQDQVAGRQMGIPALRSAQVIFYNVTWAKELGFSTPPQTPEQFQNQACAAAKANNGSRILEKYGTGGYLVDSSALTSLSWLAAFGANPVPQNDQQPYQFEGPEAKKTIEYLRKMLDLGCAWIGRNPEPHEYFEKRMALFMTGTLPEIYIQQHYQEARGNKDQWTILPFPGEDGKPVVYSSGYSYAVVKPGATARAEDLQLGAWLFIRWMTQPDNNTRLIQALPSLPVSGESQKMLDNQKSEMPWSLILPLAENVRPAPGLASWREVRRLLEDTIHQVYYQPVEQLDSILPVLDQMASEVRKP